MAALSRWKAATVKGEGEDDSSEFARMDRIASIERLAAVFLDRERCWFGSKEI